MKTTPLKRERTIAYTEWDCGVAGHRHRSKAVAVECMTVMAERRKHKENMSARNLSILKDYAAGHSVTSIARAKGVSRSRVNQITKAAAGRGGTPGLSGVEDRALLVRWLRAC